MKSYCSNKRIIPLSKSYLHQKSGQQCRLPVISAFDSHVLIRIISVIDNKRASEPIAVLGRFLDDYIRVKFYV